MSRAVSYVAIGTVVVLFAGLGVWLVGVANDRTVPESVSNQHDRKEATSMVPREFTVEGMACQGCADTITSALTKLPGVQSARVSFEEKRAVVEADGAEVPTDKIVAAIAAAGYKAEPTKAAQSF